MKNRTIIKIILEAFCGFLIFFLTGFCSVNSSLDTPLSLIDSTKFIKIKNRSVLPKTSFDFNSLVKAAEDTLYLVTCSDYVYSPFGKIKSKKDLQSSVLKQFSNTPKIINGNDEIQILKFTTKNEAEKAFSINFGEAFLLHSSEVKTQRGFYFR